MKFRYLIKKAKQTNLDKMLVPKKYFEKPNIFLLVPIKLVFKIQSAKTVLLSFLFQFYCFKN